MSKSKRLQYDGKGWFRESVKDEDIKKSICVIDVANLGLGDKEYPHLTLDFSAETEHGGGMLYSMHVTEDIEEFMRQLNVRYPREMRGKVIEYYTRFDGVIVGIGINKKFMLKEK